MWNCSSEIDFKYLSISKTSTLFSTLWWRKLYLVLHISGLVSGEKYLYLVHKKVLTLQVFKFTSFSIIMSILFVSRSKK